MPPSAAPAGVLSLGVVPSQATLRGHPPQVAAAREPSGAPRVAERRVALLSRLERACLTEVLEEVE